MARPSNTSKRGTASKPKAPPRGDTGPRIIAAALSVAAERGWRQTTFADIAAAAGIGLGDVHAAFRTKGAIVGAVFAAIDAEVLSAIDKKAADDPTRDRLFDILMCRFDALRPHKAAVISMVRAGFGDPLAGLCMAPRLMTSMAWMLEAAGVSSAGPMGRLRANGLALVYANAFRVWMRDDSDDMGPTMVALDKGLERAERMAGWCADRSGQRNQPETDQVEA